MKAPKFIAYCYECCGGGMELTRPTTKRKAEAEATAHVNVYGHMVGIIQSSQADMEGAE